MSVAINKYTVTLQLPQPAQHTGTGVNTSDYAYVRAALSLDELFGGYCGLLIFDASDFCWVRRRSRGCFMLCLEYVISCLMFSILHAVFWVLFGVGVDCCFVGRVGGEWEV